MAIETKELDSLRSVEELANYQKSVESEMEQINKEFDGLPFDDDKKTRFADLRDTRGQIVDRITELEARKAIVEGFAEDPKRSERLFDSRQKVFDSSDGRGTAKERDIYDL